MSDHFTNRSCGWSAEFFKGHVVLLTGANGMIPRAIAELFYILGATLLLTDINRDELAKFAISLDPDGDRTKVLKQDVSKSEDAIAVADFARTEFGKLDVVVTGAGVYRDNKFAGISDEAWRNSIGINLDGVFYTCRESIPLMEEGGAIVNIASLAGHRGSLHHADYACAKGGILTLTRTLALELAPKIRVNSVSPGIIDTPLSEPLLQDRGERLIEDTPLRRLGTCTEIAQAVIFLASPQASFITGETLHVNGGLYIAS